MDKDEAINNIIRNKAIWAEIKVNEEEFKRLQKQIDELEQAKKEIILQIQKKLEEGQAISESLAILEYETLCRIENEQN